MLSSVFIFETQSFNVVILESNIGDKTMDFISMTKNAKYATRIYPYYGQNIPQIVRSNTLEMAKRANGVAKIGWNMSFVLQSLWCENNTDKTIGQNYLYSLQTFEHEYQKASLNPIIFKNNKFANATHYMFDNVTHQLSNTQPIQEKIHIKHYTTLDWEFFREFEIVRNVLNFSFRKEEIFTNNFNANFSAFLKDVLGYTQHSKYKTHYSGMDIRKMLENNLQVQCKLALKIDSNRGVDNRDCFILVPLDTEIPNDYMYIAECKPSQANGLHFQRKELSDSHFREYILDLFHNQHYNEVKKIPKSDNNEILNTLLNLSSTLSQCLMYVSSAPQALNSFSTDFTKDTIQNALLPIYKDSFNETIALYACTGKFSLYFIPSQITLAITRNNNGKTLSFAIDEMLCYTYDSFDFLDQPYQPVGVWDNKNHCFSLNGSITQLWDYFDYTIIPKSDIIKQINEFQKFLMVLENYNIMHEKYPYLYWVYNNDFQQCQHNFKKGLDYKIFSSTFEVVRQEDKFNKLTSPMTDSILEWNKQ